KIEPLDDHNYYVWKYCMEMLLIQKNLWEIVSRERTRPDGPKTSHAVKNWTTHNCLAVTKIVLHVSNSQIQHTWKSPITAEVW
ncbi:hypothetical protein BS47DRAFT_1264278, partial [Hydnum rufescens UP504]